MKTIEMVSALNADGQETEEYWRSEYGYIVDTLARFEADELDGDAIADIQSAVRVRSAWYAPGTDPGAPYEYEIALTWGEPATRIVGTLDEYGVPETATLEIQDWGTPWADYRIDEDNAPILEFARKFYFGDCNNEGG